MALTSEERQIVQYGQQQGKTKEQILAALAAYRNDVGNTPSTSKKERLLAQSVAPAESGFKATIKDIGSDIKETGQGILGSFQSRGEKIRESKRAFKSGEQGLLRSIGQSIGQGAGFVSDVIGEGVKGIAKTFVSPKTEEKVGGAIESGARKLLETDFAQNLLARYQQLKEEDPAKARDLEAILGAGSLALDVGTGGLGSQGAKAGARSLKIGSRSVGELAESGAETLARQGARQASARTDDFVESFISPRSSLRTARERVGSTVEGTGLTGRRTFELTPVEQRAAEILKENQIINPRASALQNRQAIESLVTQKADDLVQRLENSDITLDKSQAIDNITQRARATIADDILLSGDSEKMANKMLEKYTALLKAQGDTAAAPLIARREFDQWLRAQKTKAFEGQQENAFNNAKNAVRNAANDYLEDLVPDEQIKQSLRDQSALLRVMDNVTEKAIREGDSALSRLLQGALDRIPFLNERNQLTKIITGTGLAAGATAVSPSLLPVAGLGLLVGTKSGRRVLTNTGRKTLQSTLKVLERTAKQTSSLAEKAELNRIITILSGLTAASGSRTDFEEALQELISADEGQNTEEE